MTKGFSTYIQSGFSTKPKFQPIHSYALSYLHNDYHIAVNSLGSSTCSVLMCITYKCSIDQNWPMYSMYQKLVPSPNNKYTNFRTHCLCELDVTVDGSCCNEGVRSASVNLRMYCFPNLMHGSCGPSYSA